ncbi:MAG: hypothetical protein GX288_03910 [Clostridiales bacterium]|jgi:hypothetical protein|nr:hypothetical protein [Clostridiales bacterium]
MTLENNIGVNSLIVSYGNTATDRTFIIIPGEPQEDIYGLEFIKKRVSDIF